MGDMDLDGGDFESLLPNIRRLNSAGINLTQYYSASLCTPARSSLMTGRYPISNGMSHGVVMSTMPWGLPLSEVLLPQYFNEVGYVSHHIGKWHLGHHTKSHLPTARGFNSSLGYYGGYQHPLSYFYEWPGCTNETGCIPDMHKNSEVYHQDGTFNVYTFANEAVDLISNMSPNQPFFLYLALPLIHMPVHPDDDVMRNRSSDLLSIPNLWRRRLGAMAIMLDSVVAQVETALIQNDLMNNTLLIFASDNGAQCEGSQMGAGSNYPLRGSKGSLYEGAVRVPGFIYSPLLGHSLSSPGTTITGLFHVTDWLPTLIGGALGRSDLLPSDLDGLNQWDYLRGLSPTPPRSKVLYNIDPWTGIAAVRVGKWKLILNESESVGWYSGEEFGLDLCFLSPTNSIQLFDLESDEEERIDLSDQYPDIVTQLTEEINLHYSASSPVFCGVTDSNAISKWFEKNEIEPWIELSADGEDYPCPSSTVSHGWCTMVSANTPLPQAPMMLRKVKTGSKDHSSAGTGSPPSFSLIAPKLSPLMKDGG